MKQMQMTFNLNMLRMLFEHILRAYRTLTWLNAWASLLLPYIQSPGLVPASLQPGMCHGFLPPRQSRRGVKLSTYIHLLTKLRICREAAWICIQCVWMDVMLVLT